MQTIVVYSLGGHGNPVWGNVETKAKQDSACFVVIPKSCLPHTVENCLLHCNLSRDFPVKQNQSCRLCQNNGTLVSVSAACVCTPRYKGGCCQGKHLVSVCSRPSLSEFSNFS